MAITLDDCSKYVTKLLIAHGLDEDYTDSFQRCSFKFAKSIYCNYVQILQNISDDDEFIMKSFSLFLWAYYTDSTLDLKSENPWQQPKYMFAAMSLYHDYLFWLQNAYPPECFALFRKLYSEQLSYQVLEKQWEMPASYCKTFYTYTQYYQKQNILLFPIYLGITYHKKHSLNGEKMIVDILKLYYSIMLALDDIVDIQYDLSFLTLTPLFSKYYYNHNFSLPTTSSEFNLEIENARQELMRLKADLNSMCAKTNFQSKLLFDRIDKLWERVWK